jgi:hypothetical protein
MGLRVGSSLTRYVCTNKVEAVPDDLLSNADAPLVRLGCSPCNNTHKKCLSQSASRRRERCVLSWSVVELSLDLQVSWWDARFGGPGCAYTLENIGSCQGGAGKVFKIACLHVLRIEIHDMHRGGHHGHCVEARVFVVFSVSKLWAWADGLVTTQRRRHGVVGRRCRSREVANDAVTQTTVVLVRSRKHSAAPQMSVGSRQRAGADRGDAGIRSNLAIQALAASTRCRVQPPEAPSRVSHRAK